MNLAHPLSSSTGTGVAGRKRIRGERVSQAATVALVALFVVFLAGIGGFAAFGMQYADRVYPGTTIAGVDRPEGSEAVARTASRRKALEVESLHLPACERLGDGERPVHELAARGEDLDVHELAGEPAERDGRLERGDAASRNHHPQRPRLSHVDECARPARTRHPTPR